MKDELFNSLMSSLEEVKKHQEGKITLKSKTISIAPIDTFTPESIKDIREKLHLSQGTFSEILGVSKKSVESWESGRAKPLGSSRRLLTVMKQDKDFLRKEKILIEM